VLNSIWQIITIASNANNRVQLTYTLYDSKSTRVSTVAILVPYYGGTHRALLAKLLPEVPNN
jgi:hypothetical protein